jgi:hypothetical protein
MLPHLLDTSAYVLAFGIQCFGHSESSVFGIRNPLFWHCVRVGRGLGWWIIAVSHVERFV